MRNMLAVSTLTHQTIRRLAATVSGDRGVSISMGNVAELGALLLLVDKGEVASARQALDMGYDQKTVYLFRRLLENSLWGRSENLG